MTLITFSSELSTLISISSVRPSEYELIWLYAQFVSKNQRQVHSLYPLHSASKTAFNLLSFSSLLNAKNSFVEAMPLIIYPIKNNEFGSHPQKP
jgi:hypothetical protein